MATATAKKIVEEQPKVLITQTRRFYLPDINDRGMWLVERLRPKYPHLQDSQIVGWLRSLMDSNESCFLVSGHAVSLFQSMHHTLNPAPIIIERFVLLDDKAYMEEALNMYAEAEKWAFNIGATRMLIGQYSDVPKEEVSKFIDKKLFREENYFVQIGK